MDHSASIFSTRHFSSFRAKPTTAKLAGNTPSTCRLYTAGRSFRADRSPAPPKMTSVPGWGRSVRSSPSINGLRGRTDTAASRPPDGVAAEGVAQGRQHLLAEGLLLPRAEAREQR